MINTLITLGPSSLNDSHIKFFAQRTNLFRLNGSHNSLDWHNNAILQIRKFSPSAFILFDIPGIKPRTNNIGEINIKKGQEVSFGLQENSKIKFHISLTREIPKIEKTLSTFSLNDGQFLFDVTQIGDGYIVGRSRDTLTLLPRKGINFPGSIYDEKQQYEVYKDFISKISDLDINGLGLSFVQTGEVVQKLKKLVPNLNLVSKIENSEGLRNCIEIANASDAIMIDRGDLAAEIGFKRLFNGIENICHATKSCGRPLIMATENLESMTDRELPSKSEVISLAHSASLGVDCIMLSEETAISQNAKTIVSWLTDFLNQPLEFRNKNSLTPQIGKYSEIWDSLANLAKISVLVMTKSGHAIFDYFSRIPDGSLVVVTQNKKIIMLCKLFRNEISIINAQVDDNMPIETIIDNVKKHKNEIFRNSRKIAAIYVSKYVGVPRANCLTIFDVDDF